MAASDTLTLVVGATGLLGSEIARVLYGTGARVRVLVRPSADPAKTKALASLGVELVVGDLKDAGSIDSACNGATTIVSTASATFSRQPGDTIQTVDEQGQLRLVDAAERAGVKQFVFVSFAPLAVDFALQRAKRAVERRLHESGLSFTVLQPTAFTEAWLSPPAGFDPAHGAARVLGAGDKPVSWVSFRDVARFSVAAALGGASGRLARKVVPLGGPDALSHLQVIRIFEELGGPKVAVEHIPEAALETQLAGASDPIQEAFAGLMLGMSRGQHIDPAPALEEVPGRLITVREYAKQMLNGRN
jgi:NADH dehydrogenase